MEILHSLLKNYVIKDDDSLYAVIKDRDQINITVLDLEDASEVGSFSIKCRISNKGYSTTDENHIYLVDNESNLLFIDKISGEVLQKNPLGALCVASLEQDNDFIYILCLLPTRSDNIKFTTYFIQKINKTTGESFKFAYKEGSPTQKLILQEDLLISNGSSITCFFKNGKEKWITSLNCKMTNPLIGNNKYIVASSQEGKIQLFDIITGNNRFGLQVPKSRVLPTINKKTLYWLSETELHSIDIHKISNRIVPWGNKTTLPIRNPIIIEIVNNEYIIGNLYGQILKNNTIFTLDKKEEWNVIVDIYGYQNKIICETNKKLYVLGS